MKDLPDVCVEIENSLPLWVGGDLEAEAQREVEHHLARCARCSERAAAVRLARATLRKGLLLESHAFGTGRDPWPRIRADLRDEGLVGRARRPSAARFSPAFLRFAAAAAVVLALAFAWTRIAAPGPGTSGPAISPSVVAPAPTGSFAPVPVQTAGLRRLQPGERTLRDSAQIFEPYTIDGLQIGSSARPDPSQPGGSPVGLERTRTAPPR